MLRILCFVMVIACPDCLFAQLTGKEHAVLKTGQARQTDKEWNGAVYSQFMYTSEFLDVAVHSISSFAAIIKKENYRMRLMSINNPVSSDMGFSLENEIQTALKPLLAKARNVDQSKFSDVVSSLLSTQGRMPVSRIAAITANPAFFTLMGLVGTLTVQEKKITKEDLDSFIQATSKYFLQYERLNQVNLLFEQHIEKINAALKDLQFDTKEYILNMMAILYPQLAQDTLKHHTCGDLQFNYLDKAKLKLALSHAYNHPPEYHYPADGISAAKNITYSLKKLFEEYEALYAENYQQVRAILMDAKTLGKSINMKQVDASLSELEDLYMESQKADMPGIQMAVLSERLRALVVTEQR